MLIYPNTLTFFNDRFWFNYNSGISPSEPGGLVRDITLDNEFDVLQHNHLDRESYI